MIVYKITNNKNGKAYIGSTVRPLVRRMSNHWSDARNGKRTLIAEAIREFGQDSFTVEVLQEFTSEDDMMLRESELITSCGTLYPSGYNLTAAPGLWAPGRSFLKVVREKISKSSKGKQISPEHRRKISETQMGRPAWNLGLKTGKPSPNRGGTLSEDAKVKMRAYHAANLHPLARPIEVNGVRYESIAHAIKATGICRATIQYRLRNGKVKYAEPPENGYKDKDLPERRSAACPKCSGPYSRFPSGQRFCRPCRREVMMAAQRVRRAAAKNNKFTAQDAISPCVD